MMITVKFLGSRETKVNKGCSSCGKNRGTKTGIITHRKFILPKTGVKYFEMNKLYDVYEEDANFLLSLTYPYEGLEHPLFVRVV